MNSGHSKTYSSQSRSNPESGIALISVLWVLLLLSSLAATVGYITRTNAQLTHRSLEMAQAEAAADAAVVQTISNLSDEQATRHPETTGSGQGWNFQGIHIAISVSKEAGRIDVNSADGVLISAFLESRGVNHDAAVALLDELQRWMTSDHSALGRNPIPPNGSLQALEELRQIPGWKARNINCWMDSLTVYTGLPGISVADAPSMVIDALKWAQEHRLGEQDWITAAPPAQGAIAHTSVIGEVLRIYATASISTDVTATTLWIGRLTGDQRNPMLTMRWDHSRPIATSSCPPL